MLQANRASSSSIDRAWGRDSRIRALWTQLRAAEHGNRCGAAQVSSVQSTGRDPAPQASPFFAEQTAALFYSACFCKNNTFQSSLTVTVSRQKGVWKSSLSADAGKKTGMQALLYCERCRVLLGSLLIWSHLLTPFHGPDSDKHQARETYHSESKINKERELRIWTKDVFNTERGLRQVRKNITDPASVRKCRKQPFQNGDKTE